MKEQFVTFVIAKEFKELSFKDVCFGEFVCNITTSEPELLIYQDNNFEVSSCDIPETICLAPLWQQSIDFIEKEYGIIVQKNEFNEGYNIHHFSKLKHHIDFEETKELAVLKAIFLCKKIEKNKLNAKHE